MRSSLTIVVPSKCPASSQTNASVDPLNPVRMLNDPGTLLRSWFERMATPPPPSAGGPVPPPPGQALDGSLFGAHRLVWGSDMPNVERNCTYRQSLDYLRRYNEYIPAADMAMVFAETSRIVNVTAAQILRRITFTLPRKLRKPSWNWRSDSVLVCTGELRYVSSIALAIPGTASALSASTK